MHIANQLAAVPVIDLQTLFGDIRDPATRGDYWWLYLTIFSTVVPTALHLMLATLSLGLCLFWNAPKTAILWSVAHMANNDWAKWCATFLLSVFTTLAIVLPVAVMVLGGHALWTHYPWIGGWYLWGFEWWADFIGATVTPGPKAIEFLDV